MSEHDRRRAPGGARIGVAAPCEMPTIDEETLSRFAHQLRSLLTAVGAAAEYMLHNEVEQSIRTEMLGIIAEQTARIDGLLEDFLIISRAVPGQRGSASEVNLYHLTREAVRELAGEAHSAGAWLVLDAAGAVPPVVGYPGPLRQAVTGTLRGFISLARPGERVVVRLEDDCGGAGVRMVQLSVMLQSDEADPCAGRGQLRPTDLSLEAARRVCESHGGTLETFEGVPGVVCRLPVATLRLAPAAAVAAEDQRLWVCGY